MRIAKKCVVDGCENKNHSKLYCSKHHSRWTKYGDPNYCKNFNRGTGRCITKAGYVLIYVEGKWLYEHRHKMEQHLGRKLTRKEVVHHIDGDKTNNDITNLELLSQSEHTKKHGRDWHGRIMSICV